MNLVADKVPLILLLFKVQQCEVFSGYPETPFHQGSSECVPLEIVLIYSNKVGKH